MIIDFQNYHSDIGSPGLMKALVTIEYPILSSKVQKARLILLPGM